MEGGGDDPIVDPRAPSKASEARQKTSSERAAMFPNYGFKGSASWGKGRGWWSGADSSGWQGWKGGKGGKWWGIKSAGQTSCGKGWGGPGGSWRLCVEEQSTPYSAPIDDTLEPRWNAELAELSAFWSLRLRMPWCAPHRGTGLQYGMPVVPHLHVVVVV